MSIRFDFFRVFVEEAIQISLFSDKNLTKSEIIHQGFSNDEPLVFKSRSSELGYAKLYEVGNYVIASLGRKSAIPLMGPPETKFEATSKENWPHALMIVNTSSEKPIGQSIALLRDTGIFREPINQLRVLADELSQKFTIADGFIMLIEKISDKKGFWEIVKSYQGRIQKLTFNLSAPNFLGLNDELSNSMKEANKLYNITNTEVSIENKEGQLSIPEGDKFITQASEYASKGGGDIRLQIKNEGSVSGKERGITATITNEDLTVLIEGKDIDTVKAICDRLFLCLKDLD